MDVVAEIGSIQLPIRDVLSLQKGDIVRLSNIRVGEPITLSVGNKQKFYCQPGVVGKKMAVQVIGKIEETDKNKEIIYEEKNGEKTPITQKVVMPKIEGAILSVEGDETL